MLMHGSMVLSCSSLGRAETSLEDFSKALTQGLSSSAGEKGRGNSVTHFLGVNVRITGDQSVGD